MVTIDRGERAARSTDVVAAMLMPATAHSGYVTLTPVNRPDLAARCELISPVQRSGLGGLWEEVGRPFRTTSQDYVGRDLERQRFTVLFEGEPGGDGGEPASVQAPVAALLALQHPLPGEYAPPLLNLEGPVQGRRGAQQWQLQSCEQNGDQLRREADGYVWQAAFDVTLAVYVPTAAFTIENPASPAAAADAAKGASKAAAPTGVRTYVVRSGDSLSRIAQAQLGNASRWREIATLNAISTPNLIRAGQVLKLP